MATYNVNTKRSEDEAKATTTALTVDWTGCTTEVLQEFAAQALIVKLQGGWRRKGIPATATVKAIEHRPGTRAAPLTPEQAIALVAADPVKRAELIKQLQGMK